MTFAAFTDLDRCRNALDQLGPVIGSSSRRVTASLLSKRLAFLATGACLYALSACDRGIDVSPDNCLIDLAHDGNRWTSHLPLHVIDAKNWPTSRREAAREHIVATLFAGLIAPLWDTLHQASGVPMRMLWENTAVRVYSLYERRLAELTAAAAVARRDDDWRFLHAAPSALFGWSANPIARFHSRPLPMGDTDPVRFRRTCCLYYQATSPPKYCRTCPLLKLAPARRPVAKQRDAV
ncbi:FhuF/siderophore biosynthesis protein [Salinisphaera dokdonensis CL-ES53]|uniref:FhuF/siderophore biosynthesis protein n=2 Tax=Salinisphaera TaxID=180541 RepID=A0ABV2B0T9_9GAMM